MALFYLLFFIAIMEQKEDGQLVPSSYTRRIKRGRGRPPKAHRKQSHSNREGIFAQFSGEVSSLSYLIMLTCI